MGDKSSSNSFLSLLDDEVDDVDVDKKRNKNKRKFDQISKEEEETTTTTAADCIAKRFEVGQCLTSSDGVHETLSPPTKKLKLSIKIKEKEQQAMDDDESDDFLTNSAILLQGRSDGNLENKKSIFPQFTTTIK